MKPSRRLIAMLVAATVFGTLRTLAQSSPAQQPDANKLHTLASIRSAFQNGAEPTRDCTFEGDVEFTAGSRHESGYITLKAASGGHASMSIALPSETLKEVRTLASGAPVGSASDRAGRHPVSGRNLMVQPYWFSPDLLLEALEKDESWRVRSDTANSSQGQFPSVLLATRQVNGAGPDIAHQSVTELIISPQTGLPTNLLFHEFPSSARGAAAMVDISYGEYRLVEGRRVPFRIQKSVNGTVVLVIHLHKAVYNTGLTPSDFILE